MTGLTFADFPALGFNPSPGDPEIASALAQRLQKAVAALREGYQVITKLEAGDSAQWQGAAADAFRAHVAAGADLPKALQNADRSLTIAQQQLSRWSESLVGYQSTALTLERAAAAQQAELQQAQGSVDQSAQNTDLSLFDSADMSLSPQQLQAGASAKAAVLEAEAKLQEYRAQLNATIQQAHELLQEHDNQANGVAEVLQYSPLAFAPSRPDWLHQAIDDLGGAIDWLHSHAKDIGDICSTLSAIVGLLALIPPLTAVCAPLAIALSAVALGMHLWAGDHGALDIGGDILGMVPGLDLVTDAVKEGRIGMQVVEGVSAVVKDADAADDVLRVAKDGTYIKGADPGVKWLVSKVMGSGISDVWTDADAVSKSLGEGIKNARTAFKWVNGSIALAYTRVGVEAVNDDFQGAVASAASHVDAATNAVTSGLETGLKDLL